MRVAIAGGHGKIALSLTRLLAGSGVEVASILRNPDHADDVRRAGADPVICDLESASEEQAVHAIDSADAVVFAAGAGPGSGPERKWTVDHGAAVKLIAAARAQDVSRYLMVSSIGAPTHRTKATTPSASTCAPRARPATARSAVRTWPQRSRLCSTNPPPRG